MPSFHIYREPDYGPSHSSRSGTYQTREITPGSTTTPSRRPSHRSISPLGSSRFEREYIPPSMTPSRVAERNAPVSVSSSYSRGVDTPSRRAPPRPRVGRAESGGVERRPSAASSSRGYGMDLSSLGGGYPGDSYGGLYRRESSGRRREPDFNRDHYGRSSTRRSPADVLGSPLGRTPTHREREFTPSPSTREYTPPSSSRPREQYREYSPFDGYDSAAPRGQSRRREYDGRGNRYY